MEQPAESAVRTIRLLRWRLPLLFTAVGLAQALVNRMALEDLGVNAQAGFVVLTYALFGSVLALALPALTKRLLARSNLGGIVAAAEAPRLAEVVRSSAVPIVSTDAEGRLVSWNVGAELLLGYTAEEVRGRSLAELLGAHEASEVECSWLLENVARSGHLYGHQTTILDRDGRELAVSLTASALKEASQGMSLVLRDVTRDRMREAQIRGLYEGLNIELAERTAQLAEKVEELEAANRQLQQLDRMRSEFVSLVTHQIRAPLTNMAGAVSRMQSGCSAVSSTCARMFVVLNQQVERLDHLVGDVLSAARIEAGELVLDQEPISIIAVIEQVLEQARARLSDRHVRLPTKPGLPLLYADRDRTTEILANFLDNADKYSPPSADIVVDLRADQSEVVVSVRDHGPGLRQSDLPRVFEKFYRSDSSDSQAAYGYGLGLYLCRLLAEAQGGRVWAENHPDGGAVFSLALPVWQDEDAGSLHPTYR